MGSTQKLFYGFLYLDVKLHNTVSCAFNVCNA